MVFTVCSFLEGSHVTCKVYRVEFEVKYGRINGLDILKYKHLNVRINQLS